MNTDRRLLLFSHVPKTAGSTFVAVLKRQYRGGAHWHIHPGQFAEVANYFRSLSPAEWKRIRCISGHHVRPGIERFVPVPALYLGFVRHPLKRAISDLAHELNTGRLSDEILALDGAARLEAHVRERRGHRERLHYSDAHLFGFREDLDSDLEFGLIKEYVEEHFAFIGISERFEESLFLAKSMFGWDRSTLVTPRTVGKNKLELSEVPQDVVERIEEVLHLNYRIYEWFLDRFDAQWSGQSDDFKREFALEQAQHETIRAALEAVGSEIKNRDLLDQLVEGVALRIALLTDTAQFERLPALCKALKHELEIYDGVSSDHVEELSKKLKHTDLIILAVKDPVELELKLRQHGILAKQIAWSTMRFVEFPHVKLGE